MGENLDSMYANGDWLSGQWVSIPEQEQLKTQIPELIKKYGIEAVLDKIPLSDIYDFMKSSQ